MSVAGLQFALIAVLVAVGVVVAVRFELFCLRDLAETPDQQLRYFTRQGWTAVIIVSIPLGGIFYFYAGKVPPYG